MIAVHLEGGGVSIVTRRVPMRPRGFARIRMVAAGICNTDLELQRGYYGFSGTPGHEFVGVVEEADDGKWIGKRVGGEINLACNKCEWCARGLGRHCPTRTVLGIVRHPGAFADYLTLPERNLHAIPNSISDEEAIFAEPLAAACEILDQVKITPGEPVAILGDGKLGLLIAQVLHSHGAHVTHFGRHRAKLAISSKAGIATRMADARLPAQAFTVTVDATGSSAGLEQAVRMTVPRGTVVMKSTVHDPVAIDAAPVIVNEISLVGSRCGRFKPAISLLKMSKVNVKPLIADRFELRDARQAFARAAERGCLKVLLRGPHAE